MRCCFSFIMISTQMINIDYKNTLNDVYRLMRYIIPLVASFALGFLLHSYYEQRHIQNIIANPNCPIPAIEVICKPTVWYYQPVVLPKTGVDGACKR